MVESSGRSPKVSVCIPTFNRLNYLRACLESVKRQTYDNLEILVSDNLSTDGTRVFLAAESGIVVNLQSSNVGMVGNWNSLLKRATGSLCILLSDDDILEPNCISELVDLLESSGAEFSYSPVKIIDSRGNYVATSPSAPRLESGREFVKQTFAQKRVPFPSAILFRRDSAARLGFFAEMGNQTDVAFRISLAELNEDSVIACNDIPLVQYRIHPSSLTDDPLRKVAGRINFQQWVAARYNAAGCFYRMAVFDLLGLSIKGQLDSKFVVDALTLHQNPSAAAKFFSWRVRAVMKNLPDSRLSFFATFPLLTIRHLFRLINNRKFHKRYV